MPVLGGELIEVAEEARRRFAFGGTAQTPGFRDWIARGGTYYVSSSEKGKLVVGAPDASWASANSGDFTRFLWAARESLLPRSVAGCDPRSIGWAIVSCYYAGFYLTLAMLRLFGFGLMYLDGTDTTAISAAPGVTTKLNRGTYALRIALGSSVELSLEQRDAKGFHELFWRYADECLTSISNELATGAGIARPFPAAKQTAAILGIENWREWLGKQGTQGRDIGWMSQLRNDVNYRLARQAWAPNYREDSVSADRLRQDVLAIVRGTKDRLGAQLRLDRDVRAMIERVCILFREISALEGFPTL